MAKGQIATYAAQRNQPGIKKKEGGQGGSAFLNPFAIKKSEKKAARRGFKQGGLQGKELKQSMRGFKHDRRQALKQEAGALVPEELRGYVNPKKYARKVLKGKQPFGPIRELAGYKTLEDMYGYSEDEDLIRQRYQDELAGGAPVDYQREQSPTLGALSEYATSRLGSGLTPEEEGWMRQRGKGAVEGSFRAGTQAEGTRLAMAGMDPRSPMAAQRAMELERARAGGLAGVEQDISQQDLARKGALENMARGVGGLEEAGRQYDVGAQLGRQGQVEAGIGDLARLSEAQRTYDFDLAEGQRQAMLAREANRKAAKALEPDATQKAGAILGGLFGGVGGK